MRAKGLSESATAGVAGQIASQQELTIVRRAYAREVLGIAGVRNDRLEQVFATIVAKAFFY
jgi:hypothetical protein